MELLFVAALVGVVSFSGYHAWRRYSPSLSLKDSDSFEDLSMDDVTKELNHGRADE